MTNIIYLENNPKFKERQEAYNLEKKCSLTRGILSKDFCIGDIEDCFECIVPKYYNEAKRELVEFFINEPYF